MKPLVRGFADQLKRIFGERRFLIMLVLLLGFSLLGAQIYRQQVLHRLPVAVVDMDDSRLSRRIRVHLSSMREVTIVGEFVGSPSDAQSLLTEGRASALVLIPSSFSSDIKRGKKGEVLVGADMSNVLVGKTALKAVAKAVGTVGAGVQLTTVTKLGARRDRALAAVVPITIEENLSFNPATNYSVYIVPGLLFFLLHVYTIVLGASLFLPNRDTDGIRVKLGAAAAIVVVCFCLGLLFAYVHLPWAGIEVASPPSSLLPLLAALLICDVLLPAALFALIPSPLMALEATVGIAMLSLMLSGITWPTDMFPTFMRQFSAWIPFTPFGQGLRTLIHYPTTASQSWPWLGALVAQGLTYAAAATAGGLARTAVAALRRRRVA